MAFIKCKTCGFLHSSDAKSCPNCGKRKTSMFTKIVAVFIIFIVAMTMYTSQKREEAEVARRVALTPEQRATEDAEKQKKETLNSARYMCNEALERALHDPDSAKIDDYFTWFAKFQSDNTIQVQPTGRAKNAFGALIKGVWNCKVKVENGTYRVASFEQIQP